MTAQSYDSVEDTANLINKIMYLTGSDIFADNWGSPKKGRFRRVATDVIMCILPISCSIAFYYHWNDFVKLCEVFMMFIGYIQIGFKFFLLKKIYKNMLSFYEYCREFRQQYAEDIAEESGQVKGSMFVKRPTVVIKLIFNCYALAIVALLIYGLFQEERTLSVPYYLALGPPYESPNYEINTVFIWVVAILLTTFVSGTDAIYAMFVSETCLQINVIIYKLTKLGKKSNADEGEAIAELHHMHCNILRMVSIIDNIFFYMFIVQLFSSFVIIAIVLFTVTNSNYSYAGFSICIQCQLALYCVYGQYLKDRVDRFVLSLSNNTWYNMTMRDKTSLKLMMTYSQRVPSLSAGGYIELSLESYIRIFKTAVTYYAFMRDSQG